MVRFLLRLIRLLLKVNVMSKYRVKTEDLHLVNLVKLFFVCTIAFAAFVYMSFAAEPFSQEVYGTTILGYNRDLLVNGRWWFVGFLFLSVFSLAFGMLKVYRNN